MKTSMGRYDAMGLLLVGSLGLAASCRNQEWPTPDPGPANNLASPGPGDPSALTSGEATDVQVRIEDFKFVPERLTISPGTKITWMNKDDEPHSATSSEKPKRFDSGVLDSDKSYSFTFTEKGSFSYFCKLHPHMTGVIEVR